MTSPTGETIETEKFSIEKERTSEYSMVDFVGAFIHQYYLEKFSQSSNGLIELINDHNDCEQIAMNMIVAEHTGQGPVLLTPKVCIDVIKDCYLYNSVERSFPEAKCTKRSST